MELHDPLADAPPPRYAVESDDEDEYYSPSSRSIAPSEPPPGIKVEFKSIYDIPSRRPLIFASGEAGLSWAKMVTLGEQRAGIYVNDLPVGLLFCPSWTSTVVVVSEVEMRTRVPLFAMSSYTTAIIDRLQPTVIAILDSYPTRVYISPLPISQESAPIRYLSLGNKPVAASDSTGIELFAPPNLLQSTTASLLNGRFLRSTPDDSTRGVTTIILLPSLQPPLMPAIGGRGSAGDFTDSNWDREILEKAHKWLFSIVDEEVHESSLCTTTESVVRPPASAGVCQSALRVVGEGVLYV